LDGGIWIPGYWRENCESTELRRTDRRCVGRGEDTGSRKEDTAMKVMVLGLDGATWDVLEPLIREGLLPNLARLREQGSWGVLGSVFPPLSPVAWTGVMT